MAKLTGNRIKRELEAGRILIDPFDEKRLGPNSYDLRLSEHLYAYRDRDEPLDMKKAPKGAHFEIPPEGYVIAPGKIYLGSTMERAGSSCYVPCVEGRSSVGRLGLFVHVTAGFGDIGFDNHWTLELVATQPVRIYAGVPICQIYFDTVEGLMDHWYCGDRKYAEDDPRPVPSKLWKDFT